MTVKFGIRFPTAVPANHVAALARRAEDLGFAYSGVLDSPLLAGRTTDSYVTLTAVALNTTRITLGPAVTNVFTRHPVVTAAAIWALEQIAPGRVILGLGTGDSALNTIGRGAAAKHQGQLERQEATATAVGQLRRIFAGAPVSFGGHEIVLPAAQPLRIYMAATGPKMLRLAGRLADGVIVQAGLHPAVLRYCIEQIHAGAREASRDPAEIELVLSTVCVHTGDRARDLDTARPLLGWFYAAASQYLTMAGEEVTQRAPDGPVFPDLGHALNWDEAVAACQFVSPTAVEKFCLIGSPEEWLPTLESLAEIGIDHFFMRHHLTFTEPEEVMELIGQRVIPHFRR